MKTTRLYNLKTLFISILSVLAIAFCSIAFIGNANPVAKAEVLTSTDFKAIGSSVRVFKTTTDENGNVTHEETDRQGIRFHVQMGVGYSYGGKTVVTEEVNEDFNGSLKMDDGFKTYTLVIPSKILGTAELNVNTDKIMKLDTSKYWFNRGGNLESVAYVYNVPEAWYTEDFAYCGILCAVDENGNETVIAQTDVLTRSLTFVAKQAYTDTIDENTDYWGTEELDNTAAPLIKKFVPTATYKYTYNGVTTTEEVLWGDKPQNAPKITITNDQDEHIDKTVAWFDTTSSQEVDVNKAYMGTNNVTYTLSFAENADFVLTGVADFNNFNANGATHSGAKVYATLPASDFFTAEQIQKGTNEMVEIDKDGVTVDYEGTGSFEGFDGIWVMLEGEQVRLAIAFDSANLRTGDKIIIKGDSVFYAHNVMYQLTEDYVIDVTKNAEMGEEDYGIFLGYLHNSDVKLIENWIEPTDETRLRIRVTFYNDLLINSDFTFVYDGDLPEGYTYPVYVLCGDTKQKTAITKGYYYWNDGEHTILELEGYAHHNNDELYGAPGTKIVQNGGYYIFEDAMYAYYNGSNWVVGAEKGTFNSNSFEFLGKNFTDGTEEIRFTTNSNTSLTAGGTTDRWFDEVCNLTVENMSDKPYGAYITRKDGTVEEIKSFMFHGQQTDSGYNHILAIKDLLGETAGDTATILSGTRLWCGNDYFTATENVVFYYNGDSWVVDNGEADYSIGLNDFVGQNYNYFEAETYKMRMHLNSEIFGGQTGPLYVESGSVKVNGIPYTNLHYHGNGNMILEIIGKKTNEDGAMPIGNSPFTDTLVIEEGTRIWIGTNIGSTLTPYCLEFDETLELRYVGDNMRDGNGNKFNYHWVPVNNVDVTASDITRVYNDAPVNDQGVLIYKEVRLQLSDGILSNDFYGFMSVDESKGVPVVNGVEMPNLSFAYNQSNDLLSVRGGECGENDGDYIMIPAGSVWWTTQGSLTFKDEIFYTYVDGAWKQGNMTGTVTYTANNATISGVNRVVVGRTYEFTVTPESGYTVSAVTVNGNALAVTDNNTYTFTAAAVNEIVITTLVGYNVKFSIGEGITVDDGAIIDGTVKAVANGKSLTFKVTLNDGYRLGEVIGATNNGDGTYTVSTATTVTITAIKQCTVTYSIPANATAKFNGVAISGEGSVVVDAGNYSAEISANAGYILKSVLANGEPLTGNNGTYSLTVNDNVELTAEVIDPINVNNTTILNAQLYYNETEASSIRIYFDKNNSEINALKNGNYAINFNGTHKITLANTTTTATQINYFGLIGETQHASLEFMVDYNIKDVQNGDKIVINEGSYIHWGDIYIYFDETYTATFETSTINNVKNALIMSKLQNAPSTYMTNLQMNADGTITSTSASSTIGFNEEFFTLLKQYGYSSVSFTIETSTTTSTTIGTRIATQGNWGKQETSSNQKIEAATTYYAQYGTEAMFWTNWNDDSNAKWTLSNVTFS